MNKGDKTRSHKIPVTTIFEIREYLKSRNIGFNGFNYLIVVINRFKLKGECSTYNSVYTSLHSIPNGSTFRVMKEAILTLENKGLIVIDRSKLVHKLYPTEKSLKEISVFI